MIRDNNKFSDVPRIGGNIRKTRVEQMFFFFSLVFSVLYPDFPGILVKVYILKTTFRVVMELYGQVISTVFLSV
jgi:hypothetical protein